MSLYQRPSGASKKSSSLEATGSVLQSLDYMQKRVGERFGHGKDRLQHVNHSDDEIFRFIHTYFLKSQYSTTTKRHILHLRRDVSYVFGTLILGNIDKKTANFAQASSLEVPGLSTHVPAGRSSKEKDS